MSGPTRPALRPAKTFNEMGVPALEDSSEKKKIGLVGKLKRAVSKRVRNLGKKDDAEASSSRHAEQADQHDQAYTADLDGPLSPFSLPPPLSPLPSESETSELARKQAWEECPGTMEVSKHKKGWPAGLRRFDALYHGTDGRARKVKLYSLYDMATYYVTSDDQDIFPGKLTKLPYDVHRQFV